MSDILLVSNPSHPGIRFIADAYNRAFQYLGVNFDYLPYRDYPMTSVPESNMILWDKISTNNYKKVIIVQPSYIMANYFYKMIEVKNKIKFYSISTEDPYSTSALMPLNPLFSIKFTNEKKVAESLKQMGYKYLPVAYDSLFPYCKYDKYERAYNISSILTYYKSRGNYLPVLGNTKKAYVNGNIAPLLEDAEGMVYLNAFNAPAEVVNRHKELEIYSMSKTVLNPHREPSMVGYSFFNLVKGIKCIKMFNEAISPNPRFYEAISCGAVPLSEEHRIECGNIFKRYLPKRIVKALYLPSPNKNFSGNIMKIIKTIEDNPEMFTDMIISVRSSETYIERAKVLLNEIEKIL